MDWNEEVRRNRAKKLTHKPFNKMMFLDKKAADPITPHQNVSVQSNQKSDKQLKLKKARSNSVFVSSTDLITNERRRLSKTPFQNRLQHLVQFDENGRNDSLKTRRINNFVAKRLKYSKSIFKKNENDVIDVAGGKVEIVEANESFHYAENSLYIFSKDNCFRKKLIEICSGKIFKIFVTMTIFVYTILFTILMSFNKTSLTSKIFDTCDDVMIAFFCVEIAMKIVAFGLIEGDKSFFKNYWNWFDLVITGISLFNPLSPIEISVATLRSLRVLRLLKSIPHMANMRILVKCLTSNSIHMVNMIYFFVLIYLFFAVISTNLFSNSYNQRCRKTSFPINGNWEIPENNLELCGGFNMCGEEYICGNYQKINDFGYFFKSPFVNTNDELYEPESLNFGLITYQNIFSSLQTIFQIATKDGWTIICINLQNAYSFYFCGIFLTFNVILLNFLMNNFLFGIVINNYKTIVEQEKFSKNRDYIVKKENERMMLGFVENEENIDQRISFNSIATYIQSINFLKNVDPTNEYNKNNLIPFYFLYLTEQPIYNIFKDFLIIINTVTMAVDSISAGDTYQSFNQLVNIIFIVVFSIDFLLKIIGLGIADFVKVFFNILDFIILVISILEISLSKISTMTAIRSLRILRILRLLERFQKWKILRIILKCINKTWKKVWNYIAVLSFLMYIFAVIGMNFFQGKLKFDSHHNYDPNASSTQFNFDNILNALLTVFSILLGYGWPELFYQCRLSPAISPFHTFIFFPCSLISLTMMVNLIIVFLLAVYEDSRKKILIKIYKEENKRLVMKRSKSFDDFFIEHSKNKIDIIFNKENEVEGEKVKKNILNNKLEQIEEEAKNEDDAKSLVSHVSSVESSDSEEMEDKKSIDNDNTHRGILETYHHNDGYNLVQKIFEGESQKLQLKANLESPIKLHLNQNYIKSTKYTDKRESKKSVLSFEPSKRKNTNTFEEHIITESPKKLDPLIPLSTQENFLLLVETKRKPESQKKLIINNSFVEKQDFEVRNINIEKGILKSKRISQEETGLFWEIFNYISHSSLLILHVKTSFRRFLIKLALNKYLENFIKFLIIASYFLIFTINNRFNDPSSNYFKISAFIDDILTIIFFTEIVLKSFAFGLFFDQVKLIEIFDEETEEKEFHYVENDFEYSGENYIHIVDPKIERYVKKNKATSIEKNFGLAALMYDFLGAAKKENKLEIFEMKKAYFQQYWNIIDFIIVVSGLSSIDFYNIGNLKNGSAFRIIQSFRPLRLVARFKNLQYIVNSLVLNIPAIGTLIIIAVCSLLCLAIMGVSFFKGILGDCSMPIYLNYFDCIQNNGVWTSDFLNFDNILNSFFVIFQMVLTPSWYISMFKVMGKTAGYSSLYFIVIMIIGNLFLMNLIISIIVSNFFTISEKESGMDLLTEYQREWINCVKYFLKFKPIFSKHKSFSKLRSFVIIFFEKGSYPALILKWFPIVCFVCNFIVMGITDNDSLNKSVFIIYALVYNFEICLKIFRKQDYFFMHFWKRFDFYILVLTNVCLLLELAELDNYMYLHIFGVFVRSLKIFKLIRRRKEIRNYLDVIHNLIFSLKDILQLIAIILTIYALLGMDLFGTVAYKTYINEMFNFRGTFQSIFVLISCSTGEKWNFVMSELAEQRIGCNNNQTYNELITNANGCGSNAAVIYFASFMAINVVICINILIAVVIETFLQNTDHEVIIDKDDIKLFYNLWGKYDINGNYLIDPSELVVLMKELEWPLGFNKKDKNEKQKSKCYNYDTLILSYDDRHVTDQMDSIKILRKLDIICRGKKIHIIDVIKLISKRALTKLTLVKAEELIITNKRINNQLLEVFFSYDSSYKDLINDVTEQNYFTGAHIAASNLLVSVYRRWKLHKIKVKQKPISDKISSKLLKFSENALKLADSMKIKNNNITFLKKE